MIDWLQVLYVSASIYGVVFLFLLFFRRWSIVGLLVGLLHLLLAVQFSVAPLRAMLDPDYEGFTLGLLSFSGRTAVLPAAVVLSWCLAAATIAITRRSGRWLWVIAAGDWLLAADLGLSMLTRDAIGTIQFGQYLTIGGLASVLIMMSMFVVLPLGCGLWAWKRHHAV